MKLARFVRGSDLHGPGLYLVTSLLVAGLCRNVLAQPDETNLGSGSPEQTLSGIRVGIASPGETIAQAIERYGQPASKEDAVVPDGAGGTRFYTWQFPGLKMSVATYFGYKTQRIHGRDRPVMTESRVAYVDVWGSAPRESLGTTGRGLALGETLARQKALYGNRYKTAYAPGDGSQSVEVWWQDGTCLMIDYGPDGRSNHIRLASADR